MRYMKQFKLLLTEEQLDRLGEKSKSSGFANKADYVRFVLFTDMGIEKKIEKIYNKVVNHE